MSRAERQLRQVVPLVLVLCVTALQLVSPSKRTLPARIQVLGWLTLGASALHLCFGAVGWFFRYEAYLVSLATVVSIAIWFTAVRASGWRRWPQAFSGAVLVVAAALLIGRGVDAVEKVGTAAAGIYRQQYQMALFLHERYAGQPVVVNDIGAVTFIGTVKPVDLAGLATFEVADARLHGTFGPDLIRRTVDRTGAEIAIVYERWYWPFGGLPREWIRVGQWHTQCWICGDETVSFYGVSPTAAMRLRRELDDFEPRLPGRVLVSH